MRNAIPVVMTMLLLAWWATAVTADEPSTTPSGSGDSSATSASAGDDVWACGADEGTNLPPDESRDTPRVARAPAEGTSGWAAVAQLVRGDGAGRPAPSWLAEEYERERVRHDGVAEDSEATIVIHRPYGWRPGLSRVYRPGVFMDPWYPSGPGGFGWDGRRGWHLGVGWVLH